MTNRKPVCILEKVRTKAVKGRSSLRGTHRELPAGERRVGNLK